MPNLTRHRKTYFADYAKSDETVNHLLSECPKLAQSDYKRHDNVAKAIHWDLCKQVNIDSGEKWYVHSPGTVAENENAKGLWDFITIQTDKTLPHNRPDIAKVDRKKRVSEN